MLYFVAAGRGEREKRNKIDWTLIVPWSIYVRKFAESSYAHATLVCLLRRKREFIDLWTPIEPPKSYSLLSFWIDLRFSDKNSYYSFLFLFYTFKFEVGAQRLQHTCRVNYAYRSFNAITSHRKRQQINRNWERINSLLAGFHLHSTLQHSLYGLACYPFADGMEFNFVRRLLTLESETSECYAALATVGAIILFSRMSQHTQHRSTVRQTKQISGRTAYRSAAYVHLLLLTECDTIFSFVDTKSTRRDSINGTSAHRSAGT